MERQLTAFCADRSLVELLELSKCSNDVLDLLQPRENQHSDLLAWCLNAREGHGQGDAILKDFLIAIYGATTVDTAGDKLQGNGLTRDFVRDWTPSRIMTTSFATAVCYREHEIPYATNSSKVRLDLLLIDSDNKLIVIIENKAGAKFRKGQLAGYLASVQASLLSREAFKQIVVAFVAMDRNLDTELAEDAPPANFDKRWALLNYEWLRPGGERAQLAVNRGNQNASLLMSYCQRQTGWESTESRKITNLAAELVTQYPIVVSEIRRVVTQKLRPDEWVPKLLSQEGVDGQLLKLYPQNENAINRLLNLTPLQLLRGKIIDAFPDIESDIDAFELGRVWANYRVPIGHELPMVDGRWPLYVYVRYLKPGSGKRSEFRIRLVWRPFCVPDDQRETVCNSLAAAFVKARNTADRLNAKHLVEGPPA